MGDLAQVVSATLRVHVSAKLFEWNSYFCSIKIQLNDWIATGKPFLLKYCENSYPNLCKLFHSFRIKMRHPCSFQWHHRSRYYSKIIIDLSRQSQKFRLLKILSSCKNHRSSQGKQDVLLRRTIKAELQVSFFNRLDSKK